MTAPRRHLVRVRKVRVPLQALEGKGRGVGKPAGSWVTDLAELRQQIMLCGVCDGKFRGSEQRYGYHRDKKWHKIYGGVIGRCDGCREPGHGRRMYVHESYFGASYTP